MNTTDFPIHRLLVDSNRQGMNSTLNPSGEDSGTLWSTEDLARFLGCTSRHVARLRSKGLPVIRVGSLVRFMPSRVIAWLDERAEATPPPKFPPLP